MTLKEAERIMNVELAERQLRYRILREFQEVADGKKREFHEAEAAYEAAQERWTEIARKKLAKNGDSNEE